MRPLYHCCTIIGKDWKFKLRHSVKYALKFPAKRPKKLVHLALLIRLARSSPLPVSEGLPGRGVKDLAFLQKLAIEETLVSDTHLCGFSLDLVKAFHTFPKLPLSIILQKMGVPSWTWTFWINHCRYLFFFRARNSQHHRCAGGGWSERNCHVGA